jgi:hypothetical protein
MAVSRSERWKPVLEKALSETQDEAQKKVLQTGLDALKSGSLKAVGAIFEHATKDSIERQRLFGGKPKRD